MNLTESLIHCCQASLETSSKMRLPKSFRKGGRSRPGRSFLRWRQWTMRSVMVDGGLARVGRRRTWERRGRKAAKPQREMGGRPLQRGRAKRKRDRTQGKRVGTKRRRDRPQGKRVGTKRRRDRTKGKCVGTKRQRDRTKGKRVGTKRQRDCTKGKRVGTKRQRDR